MDTRIIDWSTARPKFVKIMHDFEAIGDEFGIELIDADHQAAWSALDELVCNLHSFEQWSWSYDNGRTLAWQRCFYCGEVITCLDDAYNPHAWAGAGVCEKCKAKE